VAIQFPPNRKSIILCDFDLGGFRPPEMVKLRPVIVIVGRLPGRFGLATIVPLSTTPPRVNCDYQPELHLGLPLPRPFNSSNCWAKADMVMSVSYERLNLFRTQRSPDGRRAYQKFEVSEPQFEVVKTAILRALRFTA
jgi:mRNA interferase MazF